jgi:hypothetical protein
VGKVLPKVATRAFPKNGDPPQAGCDKLRLDGRGEIDMRARLTLLYEFSPELARDFLAHLETAGSDAGSHYGFDVGEARPVLRDHAFQSGRHHLRGRPTPPGMHRRN